MDIYIYRDVWAAWQKIKSEPRKIKLEGSGVLGFMCN
jgi:hypothetical protein